MIIIVDYGMGNLGSLLNIFKHIGVQARVESDPEHILRADKIVLPGVGAFDAAMRRIESIEGLRETLDQKVLVERIPLLGICLGMQLLMDSSEEGIMSGLRWIPGEVRRFPKKEGLKIPHMGWNSVLLGTPNQLTMGLGDEPRYYFIHSYFVHAANRAHSLLSTHYGIDFDSGVGRDNIFGLQFHPEKSHGFGKSILRNFVNL